MQVLWQHIKAILSSYEGKLPLHHFLKGYFKANPKLGSRDRKAISHAVYSWYRVGKAFANDPSFSEKEKVLAAMYMCGGAPRPLTDESTQFYSPGGSPGNPPVRAFLDLRKCGWLVELNKIFPAEMPFSDGIEKGAWVHSLVYQPRLFLRIRKERSLVMAAVERTGLPHEWLSETCIALPNGTRLEGILPEDAYVVQDASSQATGAYLHGEEGEHWWDCCAGAGGKSLMLADNSPGVQLLATDVRESVLQNLSTRFRQYDLRLPERKVLDAAQEASLVQNLGSRKFDGIICDVPCSGSGTWARTPEACYFFQPETLAQYSSRQHAILNNAVAHVSDRSQIVYITCSVFREENEDVVESVAAERALTIESSRLINGIAIGADSLFVAVLRKA